MMVIRSLNQGSRDFCTRLSLHVSSADHQRSIIIYKTLVVVIIYTRNIINYNKVNFLPVVYTDFMFYSMSHTIQMKMEHYKNKH